MKIQNRLRRYFLVVCAVGAMFVASPVSAWAAKSDLQVYFIDVEGGQATLFATLAGQSLLIDTGWPLNAARIS